MAKINEIYRMYDAKYKNFYTRKVVIGGEI
ncbi:MAG: hypothetical protein [Bacteriophage sp.]|jgi:hypothetical protein|nr:MAG: hypothetical protein [Bacteriophage sp.]DAO12926.1 MAG TPA: hypothetical protein [Caudoviricetes sp.]